MHSLVHELQSCPFGFAYPSHAAFRRKLPPHAGIRRHLDSLPLQDQTRHANDIMDFNGSEIASIEGIGVRIHQEELVLPKHHTALPGRQIPPQRVPQSRLSRDSSVDHYLRVCPADFIAGQPGYLLQKRPVPPDKSVLLCPLRVIASG